MMLTLLMVLALGLLSLSSIELRRSANNEHAAAARANARMAMIAAIGQLQETLGPDQRVSATAEILGEGVKQPHWTGVWRTRQADGSSWFTRDDLNGGLHDERTANQGKDQALAWLISGEGDPKTDLTGETVTLMNANSSGSAKTLMVQSQELKVPLVKVAEGGKFSGRYGWWTGDLGVRANIATADPRSNIPANRETPSDGGMFRMLASAAPDVAMMEGAKSLEKNHTERLVSAGTASLTMAGPEWSKQHGFDFTVASSGVLADVAEGGLKRDLTAYLAGSGTEPELNGRPGLSDDDSLAGGLPGIAGSADSRHRKAGPRFGVLRDWAKQTVPFANGHAAARSSDIENGDAVTSKKLALANEQPVKLAGNKHTDLQPILVEATNYTQMSAYQLQLPPGSRAQYQLRHLFYPRVVLWNPYNVELQTEQSMVMIQGNGRQEMWTQNTQTLGNSTFTSTSQWLSFEGGRSTKAAFNGAILDSEGYNDPYIGSYYFSVPATKFGPGECLVFSPAKSAEYNCLTPYNQNGTYNLASNELSCEVAPDPSRCYYVSASDIGGGIPYLPTAFWYAPTPYWSQNGRNGVENQGDDTRAILKLVGSSNSTVQFETFDSLPQLSVLSASLQFGAGREPRIAWNNYERMPVQLLDRVAPRPTVVPNVRTREGIRLRWFTEHPSNRLGSGALAGTPHFEDAVLANWNPRASYIMRSAWDNVGGSMPGGGSAGGPWFFGAYTRDLFDQAVSWDEQAPVPRGGRYHGNPFGPPQEGADRYVLFDVPRTETGVVSLAQFQHAKISELVWHPSYTVANSLADPRLGTGGNAGLNRTAALPVDKTSAGVGGFHEDDLGWSSDTQRAKNRGEWAVTARAMLGNTPVTDNLVYDLSFEANQTLWDRFFLSSGTEEEKARFREDPLKNPLPNSRLRPVPGASFNLASLKDFHRAATQLMVDGAFNVNSTRIEAWKALLGSSKLTGYGTGDTPFPRVLNPPGTAWKAGDPAWSDNAWDGYRELTNEEIQRLAEAIVEQVKLRGPFISLADFVNRRLAENETGRMGALQAAIEKAGLNAGHVQAYPLDNHNSLPNYKHPDNLPDATRFEQTLKPDSKAWGAPSYLTQGDILQVIGPALSARSDSFVIRSYGDSLDADGKVQARAWCEATVQRIPQPLEPDASGLDSKYAGQPGDFGRRFVIVSFRWLSPAEI
jgi:type II secretory pathway pseudopilin PulG